jgi:hypothetical protein
MFRHACFFAWLCIGSAAGAEGVHKCVAHEGIVYQGAPCAGAEVPMPMETARRVYAPAAPAHPAVPDCKGAGVRPARPPWRHGAMCIGMTDDEVLNLAGWGRPGAIVRKRTRQGWEEEWTYDARSPHSATLRFVNGRLAAVEALSATVVAASATQTPP